MDDLIKKVNDLYESAVAKDKELTRLILKSQDNLATLDKIQKDQEAREITLGERELKVSKIENIVLLKQEAERLLDKAVELKESTEKERKDFVEWADKEKRDIAQCRVNIDSCNEALKEREKKLTQDRETLEKEKLNYKVSIIREMDKK